MAGAWHGMFELTAQHNRGMAWAQHGQGTLCMNRRLKLKLILMIMITVE
jgi:hypothetical protein